MISCLWGDAATDVVVGERLQLDAVRRRRGGVTAHHIVQLVYQTFAEAVYVFANPMNASRWGVKS